MSKIIKYTTRNLTDGASSSKQYATKVYATGGTVCDVIQKRKISEQKIQKDQLLDIPWQKKILSSIDIAAWAGARIDGQSQV